MRHDFDCVRGQGGWEASQRFYQLQRAYGVERVRSGIRAGAVTLAWYAWLKWRKLAGHIHMDYKKTLWVETPVAINPPRNPYR